MLATQLNEERTISRFQISMYFTKTMDERYSGGNIHNNVSGYGYVRGTKISSFAIDVGWPLSLDIVIQI
jgi:hypothetical protein